MKKFLLGGLLLVSSLVPAFSQNSQDLQLPQVVPPTPEAAALNKNGQLSVGLATGAAQANIPLYEIKLKGVSVPIGLSYATNGTKVDEMPSRVGMNWTLACSGVVSRITHGYPDDQSTRTAPPSGFPTYSVGMYPYLYNISKGYTATSGGYDSEPDEFRFNAPGLSGKFIIADNGDIIEIPFSNNKIEVVGGPWGGGSQFSEIIITNPQGIKYYFGSTGYIENTVSIQNGQYLGGAHSIRTAFYIKKIVCPNGDNVQYSYTAKTFSVTTGKTNSVSKSLGQTDGNYCQNGCPPAGNLHFTENNTDINYQSEYLTGITSSKGEYITFTNEARPDNTDDVRVKSISIMAGEYFKTYYLSYIFPDVSSVGITESYGSYQKRYFLKEVAYTVPHSDTSEVLVDTLKYALTYDDPESLPPRLSYAQDHYGFYNGQNNSTLLVTNSNLTSSYNTANREPNSSSAVKGTLTRITFPTGGFEELEYEGNNYGASELVNTIAHATVIGSGNTTVNGTYQTLTYYSSSFEILRNQTANYTFTVTSNPGCSGSNCDPPPPNTVNIATIAINDLTDATTIESDLLREYTTVNFNVSLVANHTYQLVLTVRGLPNAASAELAYDNASGPVYVSVNKTGMGVRVKSVKSYDPVSNKSSSKYYKYEFLQSSASSGLFIRNPQYYDEKTYYTACNDVQQGIVTCGSAIVSSSSTNNLYLIDGLPWGYSSVIESDDEAFANGGVVHNFMVVADNTNPATYYGEVITSLPVNITTFISGQEISTKYFNKNQDVVKETYNYYSVDTAANRSYLAITAREKMDYNSGGYDLNSSYAASSVGANYDVCGYTYRSNWIQLDSTVTIDYDGSTSLKNKTTLYYGTTANVQPIKSETTNSTGETLSVEMTYPTDYPSTTVYQTMVTNNIITPVVETKQKKNTTDLNLVRSNFTQWYNASGVLIVAPETIVAKKGSNSEETKIHYYAYDNTGNPLEVAKENDARVSYIWDYSKQFAVAEIKNASVTADSIAYTSFEADGKGYWQFSGTPVSETDPPTGSYAYNLGNGNITRTISSGKSYYVTYWLKTSSGTVSVNGTTAKLLITRNGWSCYQHELQSTSSVTVSGSGTIDELRLYPFGSYMTTFTYRPFVGVSSRDEPNNQISYYEYNGAYQLRLIRDMDRHIIKQFEYQYKKQIYPCTSTTANWTATGTYRCVQSGSNNNYTGDREREDIDLNNCSATYLQKRWVNIGSYGGCTPVSNCTGSDKRVVNGSCQTGSKVLVSSQQINSTQWQCTYHYVWSDGHIGDDFTETSSTDCSIIIE